MACYFFLPASPERALLSTKELKKVRRTKTETKKKKKKSPANKFKLTKTIAG